MKKVLSIWSLAVLMALLMGVSSCKKDDAGGGNDYKGYGYLEVTVNGKTYKINDDLNINAGITGNKLFMRNFGYDVETPDADIEFSLLYYINNVNFKNATTGDYRIGDNFDVYTGNNFDFFIQVNNDGDSSYNYVSGGKHTVTNIKLLSTDASSGVLTYLIEGTFSCSFKNDTSGKILDMSGKYWTKLEVNPESKS